MVVPAKQVSFSFAARTIDFFGGQSISEDSAAIFELVKNSRDANSKTVVITFNNIASDLNSEIIIYDDGDGMSEDDIMKKWMVLGTNNRAINNKTKRGKEVWGEKGIGRMACQKLSNETNLISVKNKERVVMDFDWKKFENTTDSVDQILFDLNSKSTDEENGVTLTLTNLKSKWTSKRITELKMELSRLVSKEILLEDTQIKIKSGDEEGEIIGKTYSKLLQSITDHSPFKLNAIFSNGELKIKVMNQIDGKKIWQKNVLANSRFMSDSETGPFTVDLFYFPRAPGKEKTDTINANNREIVSVNQNNDELQKYLESEVSADLTGARNDLETMNSDKESLFEEKLKLNEQFGYNNVIAEMLRDTGIKTKIIKQYLPTINKLVNQFLQTLDFFVSFNLDENFNETIKSRHRDDFTYDSFSEGEKQRIDLSLLFTWRQIAKMKNSVSTNLLVLDETFDSSLDHDGIENLLKILSMMDANSNTFIISHKGDILDGKFESKIEFVKDRNFSKIKN